MVVKAIGFYCALRDR